jgi:hypothetical protein
MKAAVLPMLELELLAEERLAVGLGPGLDATDLVRARARVYAVEELEVLRFGGPPRDAGRTAAAQGRGGKTPCSAMQNWTVR